MKKAAVAAVLVLLLGLAVWILTRRSAPEEGSAARGRRAAVVAVECAPLERGTIRDVRVFTGSLQPRARYLVAPRTGGRLIALDARIGDPVRPAQVLARLDDEEYVQQVEQARAALEVAHANVEQQETLWALAQREKERVRALRERGIASETEWDAVAADAEAQEARLRVARAQEAERRSALKAAEVRLSYTVIRPQEDAGQGDWFVEERFVDEGAMLAAHAPVLSLVDIGVLTAVIQVIERDYPLLRAGLSARLETDAFPGESFAGEVVRVAPALREASRQARVEIEVPNRPPRLRPGMFVRASLEFARSEEALLAPRTALVSRQGSPGVFLVDPDTETVRFVPVRVGIRSADHVEILEPEIGGDVVTLGHHLLADGSAVLRCERRLEEPSAPAGGRP